MTRRTRKHSVMQRQAAGLTRTRCAKPAAVTGTDTLTVIGSLTLP